MTHTLARPLDEAWINSLPIQRADLIREGEAAEQRADYFAQKGNLVRAANYERIAEEAFAESRLYA